MQIKTFQAVDHKIKALVYGASGCGKTVLGSTAPNPIFASAEGGLLSIKDKNPQFVEIKSYKDLQELLNFLQTQKHTFETVIIDSITEVNDIIKMDIEKRTGKAMQLQDWGELAKKIKALFRGFRDLPLHVIFIAQETSEMDEGVVTKVIPSLNGKAATEIAYFMDIVGYLMIDKTGERKLLTNPNAKLLTKDRSNLIGNGTEVDFGVWVEKIGTMKTGDMKVSVDYEVEIDDKTNEAAPLPQPKKTAAPKTSKEPMITEKTGELLFQAWDKMWSLYMEKTPDELDTAGALKYTAEKSDPTRKKTIEALFKVDSSTKMTEKQGLELLDRCNIKIADLEKIETPKVEKTIGRQIEELEEQLKIMELEFETFLEGATDTEEFRASKKAKRKAIMDMEEKIDDLKAIDPFRKETPAIEEETVEHGTEVAPTTEEVEVAPVPPATPSPVPPTATSPGKTSEEMVAELKAKTAKAPVAETATAEVAEAVFGQ